MGYENIELLKFQYSRLKIKWIEETEENIDIPSVAKHSVVVEI